MAGLFWRGNNLYFRFRGSWGEAGKLEYANGNWIVFMRDLDNPNSYISIGETAYAHGSGSINML